MFLSFLELNMTLSCTSRASTFLETALKMLHDILKQTTWLMSAVKVMHTSDSCSLCILTLKTDTMTKQFFPLVVSCWRRGSQMLIACKGVSTMYTHPLYPHHVASVFAHSSQVGDNIAIDHHVVVVVEEREKMCHSCLSPFLVTRTLHHNISPPF